MRRSKTPSSLLLLLVSVVLLIVVGIVLYSLPFGAGDSKARSEHAADVARALGGRSSKASAKDGPIKKADDGGGSVLDRKLKLLDQARALKASLVGIDARLEGIERNLGKLEVANMDDASAANAGPAEPMKRQPIQFPLHRHLPHSSNDTIFVSIASFRDSECAPMVQNMFAQAKHPELLYVGLVEQHGPRDPLCLDPKAMDCMLNAFCPSDHIRIRRISAHDAKGPTFGRYMAMLLYRGQKYFLMVDSHNYFIPFWDMVLVRMYTDAASLATTKGKLVLSHYPDQYKNITGFIYERSTTSYLCRAKYLPDFGYLRLDGIIVPNQPRPMPQPWAAAGFLFASAALIEEVPFDPYLDFLFDGEEILYSVRMWTHGWDIFSPNTNVMFHSYVREGAPKVWSEVADWSARQAQSAKRVQHMLRSVNKGTKTLRVPDESLLSSRARSELQKYGLGSERSLDDWNKFAGADPENYALSKNFCL